MFAKNSIKMLVCDMAGTVIQENNIVYNNLFKTIKSIEPNVDKIDINKFYGFNKNEVLKYYINNKKDINLDEKEVMFNETKHKFNDMLRNDYINNPNVKLIDPKLPKFFNNLRNNNIKITLNTGYNKEIQNILIDKLNLLDCIDDYISSEEVKYSRPYPNMINTLMERNNILKPKEVIKIGDTCIDIIEGHNANCHTIGVLSGSTPKYQLKQCKPTLILNNIIDLRLF